METTQNWIDNLVGDTLLNVLACCSHGDRIPNPSWDGTPISDRAAIGVQVADRMLTALGRVPGMATTGCEACSRVIPDEAAELASDNGYPLPYRHNSTQNQYGETDDLTFCGFCQILDWPCR